MPKALVDIGPLKPLRRCESEQGEGGLVTVHEVQRRGWFGRLLARGLAPSHNHVKLDDTGSLIWELCDGERDVHAIAQALAERFGEDFDPTNQRLAVFLQTMRARGWIGWRDEE